MELNPFLIGNCFVVKIPISELFEVVRLRYAGNIPSFIIPAVIFPSFIALINLLTRYVRISRGNTFTNSSGKSSSCPVLINRLNPSSVKKV